MPRRLHPLHLSLLCALALAGLCVAAVVWYAGLRTLPTGLTVGGLSARGLTLDAFERRLQAGLDALGDAPVRLVSERREVPGARLTLRELGLRASADDALRRVRALREGSPLARAQARWRLRHAALAVSAGVDADALRRTAGRVWAQLARTQPVDARRVICADDRVTLVPGADAYRVDVPALAERLRLALPAVPLAPDALAAPLEVALPAAVVRPRVTLERLRAEGVEAKIAEFTTTYPTSGEGRLHNIQSAARTVHDTLLPPGEVFDYADAVRRTERTYGFREAPVIFNGKLVPGIGGGICQVSTTLYNAVLRAGLDIVERRNHSLPVSYVPLGQDATFSTGYINFRFRNSTGKHLIIRTSFSDSSLTVKLFGRVEQGVRYTVASTVVKELPPPVKRVVNPILPAGREETLQKGKSGFVVETYRTKWKDGNPGKKTLVSRDTYAPQPTIVAVRGSGRAAAEDEPARPPVVEDGVSGPTFR